MTMKFHCLPFFKPQTFGGKYLFSIFHFQCFQFIIEILITLIMPIPGLNSDLDKYFGLFMFIRFYVILRVAKHFSPMYQKRKFLKRIPGSVKFLNSWN